MSLNSVRSELLAPPVGPFSQMTRTGEFLYLSAVAALPLGASVEINLVAKPEPAHALSLPNR